MLFGNIFHFEKFILHVNNVQSILFNDIIAITHILNERICICWYLPNKFELETLQYNIEYVESTDLQCYRLICSIQTVLR